MFPSQMKRKTLSLPDVLVSRIQAEADADRRSFNFVAVEKLSSLFLPTTVRQSGKKSTKSRQTEAAR